MVLSTVWGVLCAELRIDKLRDYIYELRQHLHLRRFLRLIKTRTSTVQLYILRQISTYYKFRYARIQGLAYYQVNAVCWCWHVNAQTDVVPSKCGLPLTYYTFASTELLTKCVSSTSALRSTLQMVQSIHGT